MNTTITKKSILLRIATMLGGRLVMTLLLTLMTVTAWADGAKTLPYTYGFENNDLAAEGWTTVDCLESSIIFKYRKHSGNYCFYFDSYGYGSTSLPQYLISPEIDSEGRDYIVSFYIYNYANFQVGYSITTNDLSNFTWEDVTHENNPWSLYEKEFPSNAKYIAIKTGEEGFHLDDFSFEVSGCLPPENLTASDITDNSATLTWTAPSTTRTVTGYAYQIVQQGMSWETDTEVMDPSLTSVTFDNLLPNTSYVFRVNAFYAEGVSHDYATITILTDCSGSVSLPFSEDFENGLGCWRVVNIGEFTNISAPTGKSNAFRFTGHSSQYLISPQLDCPEKIALSLKYLAGGSDPKIFQVGYSTTTNDVSDFNWGTEVTATGRDYIEYTNTFPAGTKYIAVKYCSNTTFYLWIDDFNVYVDGVLPPAQFSASTVATQSATLTWDAAEGATSYTYQYKKVSESTWSDEATTTATSAAISGLTPDTDYHARVKSIVGSNTSIYTSTQFTTAPALPYDQDFESGYVHWTMVDCNVVTNETLINKGLGTGRRTQAAHDSNTGFQFFLYGEGYKNPQYLISPRFAGDVAIKLSFYYSVPTNIEETFYVGYSTTTNDKDAFTFGDAITASSSNWTRYENTFPAEARYFAVKYTSNQYVMYIDDFCFEEYSTYATPTIMGLLTNTETEATLAWDIPTGATGFAYQYKKMSDAVWSAEVTLKNYIVTLTGLTPNTYYNFRVKALYGSNASNYITGTFQTDANVVDLPYSDGFENGMGGWRMRQCEGATKIAKTDYPHGGSYCFWFFDADQNQYLLSPHFAGGKPMKVSFYYQNYENYPALMAVGYTIDKDADVTWIDQAVIANSGAWTLYETTVPAEAQYVVICCRKAGYMLYLDDFCFTELPEIVFADNADNTTTITNYSGEDVVATLQGRTLYTDGDWNTLCLPFDINKFAGTPLEGATVMTLGSTDFSAGTLTLNFEDATSIEAGKPYIVKWKDGVNVTIGSAADWNAFAESVNGGKSYEGKTVMLTSDISGVETMAGTAEHPFRGTFEGAGHTLNVNISGDEGAAPFHYINGATIRNVKTTGSVSGGNHSAGLVGIAQGGTNSIRDCYVAATVSTSGSYVGGILGNGTTSTTTISNCLFGGSIAASYMGILYGWGEDGGTHKVENCVAFGSYSYGSIDLLLGSGDCTVTNCWKNTDFGTQGDNSTLIYTGSGTHPLVSGYLGSQWTYENENFVLSPTVSVVDANIVNPVFEGVTIDATEPTSVAFTGGTFTGTYSPLGSVDGLLFDAHNPSNGACRAYLSIDVSNLSGFEGWYTDPTLTNAMTTIPFDVDGTVKLYAKWAGSLQRVAVTFAKEGFSTYYDSQFDLTLPAGVKAYIVTASEGAGSLTYQAIADGDGATNTVPKGTAVMLRKEASNAAQSIDIPLASPTAAAISETNLLHGSDTEITTTGGDAGAKYYKLSYGTDQTGNGGEDLTGVLGWFWGAADGAAFTSAAHKAWLVLPSTAGTRGFFGLPGDDETTLLRKVNSEEVNSEEWFSLDGRRLNGRPSAKGLYIHNGSKVAIK